MALIVTDDFNRTDSTGLGSNWTSSVGGGFDVVSNRANSHTASVDNAAVFSGASWTGGNDQYSQAVVITKPASQDCGVICRGATGAETFYYFSINQNGQGVALGSSMSCALFKTVAGVFTLLGSASSFVVSSGDILYIEANGSNITAKLNGVTKFGPSSDSAIASGKPGLFGFGNGNVLDDFAAGDFSLSPPLFNKQPMATLLRM